MSALGSITGAQNRIGLKRKRAVCVVLVDGLGSHNIRQAAGHARALNAALTGSKSISCGFPSTTAASITSFGTGLAPAAHGIFGYKVADPASGKPVSMLTDWNEHLVPEEWQTNQTVAEAAGESGVTCWFIGPAEYRGSGFTRVSMRGAEYLAAKTIADRFAEAKRLLASNQQALIYLYVPELDQLAHAFGSDSDRWLAQLETLDTEIAALAATLKSDAGLVVTADHGILDVPRDQQIYLDELQLAANLRLAAGDPRCIYAYLLPGTDLARWIDAAQAELGDNAYVASIQDWQSAGWFGGEVSEALARRLPEAIIVARSKTAFYDRRSAPPKSLNMIGQHGGISDIEMQIPLLRWGI